MVDHPAVIEAPLEIDASHTAPEPPGGPNAPCEPFKHHTTASLRAAYLIAILLPFAGLVTALVLLWPLGLHWIHPVLLGVMYLLTGLGVTVGYHRLFTHRSFRTSKPVAFIVGVLGSMAVEGPVMTWVATHRKHHQHSDQEEDPHSPNTHGSSPLAILRGMFHAHMGWMISPPIPNLERYVPDLKKERVVRVIDATFLLWAALGLIIPAVVAGLVTQSWIGALLGFLWGGLVRVFLIHHVTWSVNSVCHLWGRRPFQSHDESRNNFLCGVLALGEGWHNNHHAFPTSARHGLHWWQVDVSYLVIRAMALIGLAREIRVPSQARIEAARRGGPLG